MLQFYQTVVFLVKVLSSPHFEYCGHIWGGIPSPVFAVLGGIQDKIICLINDDAPYCLSNIANMLHSLLRVFLSTLFYGTTFFCSSRISVHTYHCTLFLNPLNLLSFSLVTPLIGISSSLTLFLAFITSSV